MLNDFSTKNLKIGFTQGEGLNLHNWCKCLCKSHPERMRKDPANINKLDCFANARNDNNVRSTVKNLVTYCPSALVSCKSSTPHPSPLPQGERGHLAAWLPSCLAAFTLAEVLITLGVIGVVAAVTMPTLIQKNREKEVVTKLKKFNSIMNQAFTLAKNENGEIESWGLTISGMKADPTEEEILSGYASSQKLLDIISPYLKVVSSCQYGSSDCIRYDRHSLDGTLFGHFYKYLVLSDGMSIVGATVASGDCTSVKGTSKQLQNVCGEIMVDLNGSKAPNATGKDIFVFYYTKFGFVPLGTPNILSTGFTFENSCNRTKEDKLNGYGCAAWIIYNENMDYLHCDDLSWDGKTKCK